MKRILALFLVLLLMLSPGCKKQTTETAAPDTVVEKEETGTSDTVVEKEETNISDESPSEPVKQPEEMPEKEPEEESPQPVAPDSDEEASKPSPEEEEKATRIDENFCAPKPEDSFVPGEILITIKKEYSEPNKIWSVSDFSELEILSVEDLFTIDNERALAWINKDQFQQILKLTLASPTKEAVIETIPKLSMYDFIQTAGANSIDFPEVVVSP